MTRYDDKKYFCDKFGRKEACLIDGMIFLPKAFSFKAVSKIMVAIIIINA